MVRSIDFLIKLKLRRITDWRLELKNIKYYNENSFANNRLYYSRVLGLNKNNKYLVKICNLLEEADDSHFNESDWLHVIKNVGFERSRIIIYSLEANRRLVYAQSVRKVLVLFIEERSIFDLSARFLRSRISKFEFGSRSFNPKLYLKTLVYYRNYINPILSKLVQKKSIIVIGPNMGNEYQSILENHESDLIVFLNYKGQLQLDDSLKFSSIYSYYNAGKFFSQSYEYDINFLDSLSLIYIKDRKTNYRVLDNKPTVYLDESMRWFLGGPNLIPLLIHNLLISNPSEIYLTGFDLFTSFNYISGYKEPEQLSFKETFFIDESVHGILSNFKYLKLVKLNPVVKFDDKISNILEKSEEEYLTIVEKS